MGRSFSGEGAKIVESVDSPTAAKMSKQAVPKVMQIVENIEKAQQVIKEVINMLSLKF